MAPVQYQTERGLDVDEFIDVLKRSGLAERRPCERTRKIQGMLENASVIVTARDSNHKLIGVSRAISDFHYCTYLSDLAVDELHQGLGIGKQLVQLTHEVAGLGTTLILLAAPAAVGYYPHIGFEKHDSCWIRPAAD